MLIKKYKRLTKILNNQHDQSHILFSHHKKQLLEEPYLRLGSTSYSFITVLGVMSMLLLLLPLRCIDAVGYSYTRFVGPVAGPEHKIYVNDANVAANGKTHHHGGVPRLDYVAKAEYNFAYGVEDADAHILHNRNEMRDGDAVKGVYSLIDPDGALRVVKYTADDINGFQAEVIRNGVSSLHGQLQHDYKRAPPSEIINNNYYKPDREQYHYPQSQTHLKADTSHKYYPSSNIYSPNLEQLPQINHEQYNPHKHYQPPPQPPIIYHFNNNNNDDDDNDDDSGSDYRDEPKPQYEVHEKPNNYYNDKQEDDDVHYDENGHGHKSNNDDNVVDYKKKKQHPKEEDDDDDDDYDDEDESEELEEYDETVHNAHNSNESDEYY